LISEKLWYDIYVARYCELKLTPQNATAILRFPPLPNPPPINGGGKDGGAAGMSHYK